MKRILMLLLIAFASASGSSVIAKMMTRRPIHVVNRNQARARAAAHSRTNSNASLQTNSAPNPFPGSNSSQSSQTFSRNNTQPLRTPAVRAPRSTNELDVLHTNTPALKRQTSPINEKPVIESHYDNSDPVLEFQKRNAAKGDPRSQYALGMRYLNGIGVEQNEVLAREYLEKSAAQGDTRASQGLKALGAEIPFEQR